MRFTHSRSSLLLAALLALPAAAPPTPLEAQGTTGGTPAQQRNAKAAQVAVDTLEQKVTPSVTRYCKTNVPAYMRTGLCAYYPRQVLELRVHVDSLVKLLAGPVTPPVDTTKPPPVDSSKLVASVEIHANGTGVAVGGTLQLYADPKNASGQSLVVPVQWGGSPLAVATVSGAGLLTGKSAGSFTATATAGTVVGSRVFTVTGSSVPPVDTTKPPPVDTTKPPPVDTTTPKPPTGTVAELPRVKPAVPYPSCARTTVLTMVSSLQAALDAAQYGDCLALQAGASYVGNFTWKARAGSGYVTVLTNGIQLPAPGSRMTPSECLRLSCAKILSPNYTEALGTAASARGLILRGVEISYTQAAVATSSNVLLRFSDPNGNNGPSDMWVDRSYVHGLPQLDMRRCVLLNARMSGVVDSWVDECHSNNSDSQAILGYVFTQGILIQNNTLAAGHEIVMWGGSDTPSASLNPSDIWLLYNHIYHPPQWYKVWQVKNCLETKNVDRYVIEGNVVENCWADAQNGFAFVFKSENQSGTAAWSGTHDITMRLNLTRNVTSGWNLSGKGSNPGPNITAARFTLTDNIIQNICEPKYPGTCIPLQILSQMTDLQMVRNTMVNPRTSNQSISFDGTPSPGFIFTNNIVDHGQYGVHGSGSGDGNSTLAQFAPGAVFTSNIIPGGGSCTQYPAGNFCPATFPASSSSVAGASEARVMAATAKVVVVDAPYGRARQAVNPRSLKYPPRSSPAQCQTADWWKSKACTDPVPMGLR